MSLPGRNKYVFACSIYQDAFNAPYVSSVYFNPDNIKYKWLNKILIDRRSIAKVYPPSNIKAHVDYSVIYIKELEKQGYTNVTNYFIDPSGCVVQIKKEFWLKRLMKRYIK